MLKWVLNGRSGWVSMSLCFCFWICYLAFWFWICLLSQNFRKIWQMKLLFWAIKVKRGLTELVLLLYSYLHIFLLKLLLQLKCNVGSCFMVSVLVFTFVFASSLASVLIYVKYKIKYKIKNNFMLLIYKIVQTFIVWNNGI